MAKGQDIGQKLLIKKHGIKTGIEFLSIEPKANKMSSGVKVLINTKDEKGNQVLEKGYILRRIDAHCYHIVGEYSNREYYLSKEEFQEIQDDQFLYGIRNKIR